MSTSSGTARAESFNKDLGFVASPSPSISRTAVANTSYDLTKRVIDITGSVVLLAAIWPIMLVVALAIRITSPGPIIFPQRRPGLNSKLFWCYKFRTMVVDAENRLESNPALKAAFENNFKLKNDPRLTPIGKFLRKTSLDELPQLFNVLQGTMSLIGPRPILTAQLDSYLKHGEKVFTVKPGLGGYWQVYGRSNTSHIERVRLDLTYVENRSTWFDLKLLFLTAYTVIKGHGAY